MPPYHDLGAAQRFAALSPAGVIYRDELTVECVVNALGCDGQTARRFILDAVGRLAPGDYAHTLTREAPPADVYGWRDGQGRGWYIKLALLANGRLRVISFHSPDRPLQTRTGVVKV